MFIILSKNTFRNIFQNDNQSKYYKKRKYKDFLEIEICDKAQVQNKKKTFV